MFSKCSCMSTCGLISDSGERILDLAVCKRLVHSRIQARDGPVRRPILHGKSLKVFHQKTRESLFNHRRHILQGDDARRRYDRERAEFACEDEIDRPNRCNEIELDGTIEKIDHALLPLLIGNMRGANAGLQLEQLADEMSRRSKSSR